MRFIINIVLYQFFYKTLFERRLHIQYNLNKHMHLIDFNTKIISFLHKNFMRYTYAYVYLSYIKRKIFEPNSL